MFGGYFLYAGLNHFLNNKQLAQYAAAKHVPQPEVAVGASGAMLMLGGASLLTGIQPKIGAAAVVGFLASVSPVMHDFWNHEDAGQKQADMINFTKNVALAGAALALLGVEEPWPASLASKER